MRSVLTILSAFALPLLVHAQTTTTAVPASVPTVLVPFGALPACAQKCGPLFDAQGACAPTTITSTSDSCFCAYSTLQAFYTGTTGVCDSSGCDTADMTTIQTWFKDFCASEKSTSTSTAGSGSTATSTGSASSGTTTVVPDANSVTDGGTWLSTHWKYLIMLVVIVLAIVLGWVGACMLRRRIHRRRDAAFELRPPAVTWNSGGTPPPGLYGNSNTSLEKVPGDAPMMTSAHQSKGKSPLSREVGVNDSMINGGRKEKRISKKWMPKERT